MTRLCTFLTSIAALATGLRPVLAQCSPCNAIRLYIDEPGGVDPNDDSLIGIFQEFCACSTADVTLTVAYTGVDNIGSL